MRIPSENFARSPARRRLDSSAFDRSQFCALSLSLSLSPLPPFLSLSFSQLSLDPGEFLENRRDFDTYFISAHVAATRTIEMTGLETENHEISGRGTRGENKLRAVSSLTVIERAVKCAYHSWLQFCTAVHRIILRCLGRKITYYFLTWRRICKQALTYIYAYKTYINIFIKLTLLLTLLIMCVWVLLK